MPFFRSYQSRLITIMVMLIVFVIIILSISNYAAHWIIEEESSRYQAQAAKLYERDLVKIKQDLIEYSRLISEDSRVQKFLYAVTRIGVETSSLDKLSAEQLRPSVDHNIIIFSDKSKVLYNSSNDPVSSQMHQLAYKNVQDLFYISDQDHFKIISYSPIYFNKEKLGSVLVYKNINSIWLNSLPRNPGTQILMVKDNKIISATLNSVNVEFSSNDRHFYLNNEKYHLTPVYLSTTDSSFPQLWLAESETRLFFSLQQYNKVSLIIIISSSLFMLLMGIVAIKRISRTFYGLVEAAEAMTQGRKPEIRRSNSGTEIDVLYNQFADMVDAIHAREKEVEEAHALLKKASITDELTLLYNRRYLAEVFPKLQAQAERSQTPLCAVLCDIDFFKKINDTYGHTAGDQCLVYFSNLLRSITRTNDYLFRMGGEEFLILSLSPSIKKVASLANKICQVTASQPIEWEGQHISMTVSCGISCVKQLHSDKYAEESLSQLVSSADHALYSAKNNGRNQVCIDEGSAQPASQLSH